MKVLVVYVPVIHEGYRRFFEKHAREASHLYILGKEITKDFRSLEKDINALPPEIIKKFIETLGLFDVVTILDQKLLGELKGLELIMPDEDVSRALAETHFKNNKIEWDSIFLRWDKHKTMAENPVSADQKISKAKFDQEVISKLQVEAEKSSDFWRRIASCAVRDGKILLMEHNIHLPSEQSPHIEGDPRNNLHKGVGIELSSGIHSEAKIVAEAARRGISLDGASLYVTTFPCPPCAKQIAFAGIKKLYYTGGYSMLDQERILKSKGVEIIFVDLSR
jgi:dCMP deaminase